MRPIFQAELVNRAFGDPGLYLDLKFERRALLFDVGDITELPVRKLLRVSDIFVSHTHMDHFAGFDRVLRVCLGRDTGVNVYGPQHFIAQMEHKLHAYTWNLVQNYATDFVITAHEFDGEQMRRARFASKRQFEREALPPLNAHDGVLLNQPNFKVRAHALDHHGLPSLCFVFEEGTHINVWKNRLQELQLPAGPWLTELKQQVRNDSSDETPITVRWRDRDGVRERVFTLGDLKRSLLEFVPGQRVAYVTDVAGHEGNRRRLVHLLRDADVLYIEAVFLHADLDHATHKDHLTARQAGEVAREARAKSATPFHFSPRYIDREDELRAEFYQAWRGDAARGPIPLTPPLLPPSRS